MADEIKYIPITTEDAVEAVLSGAWLYLAEIPDLRALIEGVQADKKFVASFRADGALVPESLPLTPSDCTIHCVSCRVLKCDCRDLRVHVGLNLATPRWYDPDWPEKYSSTLFAKSADFARVSFQARPIFTGATFGDDADFSGAKFESRADIDRVTFTRNAGFTRTEFSGYTTFHRTEFGADADFSSSAFRGDANFHAATFELDAGFQDAIFIEDADFSEANFANKARFCGATFSENASFEKAQFCLVGDFARAKLIGHLTLPKASLHVSARLDFGNIDLRPGGGIELTIDQIGRSPRRKLIEGEDSTDKEKLGSAAAQYNMLRNNFRGLPSTDPEEDRCHYKYMDLRRRASDWRWPHRVADWVFLKWCWGYGIYTYRIVATIALVIFGFGALYHVAAGPATIRNYYVTSGSDALPDIQTAEADPQTEFSPLYFSIITFTTIGYGDYAPRGWLRWFAGVEGLMGLLLMAVFTVSFARKFIR